MYDTDENESDSNSEEYYAKETVRSRKRRSAPPKKPKHESLTWAEAAEIVLSNYDHPLPHKDILQLIEDSKLKSMGRGNSAPLAVLNSMLNSHSKGPGATFYRSASGSACFGLNRTRVKSGRTSSENSSPGKPFAESPLKMDPLRSNKSINSETARVSINPAFKMDVSKAKTYAQYKRESRTKQKLTPPTKYCPPVRQLKPPRQLPKYSSLNSSQKQQLIPPGSSQLDSVNRPSPSLGTISKATYDRLKQQPLHRRMGPTTSALVRPAPPFSRPPPGAALRVMPPKKRVKLDEDDDTDSEKNNTKKMSAEAPSSRVKADETSRRESTRNILRPNQAKGLPQISKQQQSRPTIDRHKQKQLTKHHQSSQRANIPRSSSRSVLHVKPRSNMTFKKSVSLPNSVNVNCEQDTSKQNSFLGVKFKRLKKANLADQIKRSKEGKLDLMSPDSILTSVHIKDLLNERTFKCLPSAYQYQLLVLLPECDRKVGKDGALRLSLHALNNAFFNRACQEFKDKLLDGEFNSDIIQRAKNEVTLHTRLDSWKTKFFEPTYGKSSLNDCVEDEAPPKLQPVESSWTAFLKFAENSTNDFEEALAKIQCDAQKQAEKDARENAEKESKKKSRLSIVSSKKLVTGTTYKPSVRSPVTLKSKGLRAEIVNKEKSKRALKKAQQLQRKKAFDKQLKDAKAKIVQKALSGARKEYEKISRVPQDVITKQNLNKKDSAVLGKFLPPTTDFEETCNSSRRTSSANITEIATDAAKKRGEKENTSNIINLSDSSTLRNLIKTSGNLKPVKKPPAKRKANTPRTIASRIVYGPSTFGTNAEGVCPCNLKAMVSCKQCGSFWHGDCVNADKLCLLCTS